MSYLRSLCLLLAAGAASAGCATALDDPTPYVTEPRVLAVRLDPPEVGPGEETALTALYADQTGAVTEAALDWAFCRSPRPLAELGPVAPSCLDPGSPDLAPIGSGLEASAVVPEDACSLFGPNPPPPLEGQPAGRPADPDVTGGYYQPIVGFPWDEAAEVALAAARVRCGLANVGQELYIEWNRRYLSNANPEIGGATLERGDGDGPIALSSGVPLAVGAGERIELTVSWEACPDEPAACGGAETYVVYAPATGELVERREAISAAWYATGGTLALARNGRDGADGRAWVENGWTAPHEAGEHWLGVVLRDERGGIGFAGYRLRVEPRPAP